MCSCSARTSPIRPARARRAVAQALFGLLLASGAGCPATPPGVVVRKVERPPTVEMSLGPSDVFDVRVYGEPELSGSYRVTDDGTIDFPLIGRLTVRGLSPAQTADDIQKRLGSFLKQPQVTVFVREWASKKITVYGQVRTPGQQSYVQAMTITQAISIAGGLTAMAARDKTRVTRVDQKDGRAETFVVNLKDVAEGSVTCYLHPGDEIFVPERVF